MGARLDLGILGPLEVRVDGSPPRRLGGLRQRSLLAVLALHPNQVLSSDRIIDELWGESAAATAAHTVQVFVSRLRGALGEGGGRLITRPPGYLLELDVEELDATRCERLYERARSALRAGDAAVAVALLHEVESLWRGAPLTEFTYEPFAQASIARLEELRAGAREEMIEAQIALGRHAEVVPELEALVREHPFRERPRGQLMLALYRSGRQAEALEVYQQARQLLVDELALDPTPALQELEQKILRQDESLGAPSVLVDTLPVAPPPEPAIEPEPVTEPELVTEREPASLIVRKTVTVLVARIELASRVDPEVERSRISAARREAEEIIGRYGGSFTSRLGGEILGVFGLPLTREDDAVRAACAAHELAGRVSELAAAELEGLVMRAFVDTGEVVADERGDVSGDPLNTAVALVHAAQPSEVLVSHRTHELASSSLLTEAAPDRNAHRVLGINADRSTLPRGPRPMVGRSEELAAARTAFDRVVDDGQVHLLTVLGEAGIGKSRLVGELVAQLDGQAQVLIGRCLSYGDAISLWPLREGLTHAAGGDTPGALRAFLGDAPEAELVAEAVAGALGLAPAEVASEQVPWAFRRLLEIVASRGPVVLVIEDAHWAEPPLLDLIDELVDWVMAPVLLVCLARPELLEVRPAWGGGHARVSSIVLAPLSDEETVELLEQHAGERRLSETDRAALVEVADGNPLFVEQLLAMQTRDPGWGAEREIPTTIHTLLAARLDRLGPGERGFIDRASVIGREFSAEAVVELLPPDARASITQHVRTLVRRGLIEPYRGSVPGAEELRFHHMLIRDVAYRSIGKAPRSELHERFADALASRSQGFDEFVGYHLEQAFRYRVEVSPGGDEVVALGERAGDALGVAGRSALGRGDASAATRLLRRSCDLFDTTGSVHPDVLLDFGNALMESGEYRDAERVFQAALERAELAQAEQIAARATIELSYLRVFLDPSFQADELEAVAQRAIAVFGRVHDESGLARARLHLADVHFQRACFARTEEELALALEHAERAGAARERSQILTALVCAAVIGPQPVGDGLRLCDSILERGEADMRLVAFTETNLAVLEAMTGHFGEARARWRATKQRFEEVGLNVTMALLHMYRAFVELLASAPEDVEPELADAYSVVERTGEQGHLATIAALRARLLYVQTRYEECGHYIRVSRDAASEDDVVTQILWRGTQAKLLARRGELTAAEELANSAVTHAEGTDALMLHAHALRDRAEVLAVLNDAASAAVDVEEAASLYAAKGITVPVRAAVDTVRSSG